MDSSYFIELLRTRLEEALLPADYIERKCSDTEISIAILSSDEFMSFMTEENLNAIIAQTISKYAKASSPAASKKDDDDLIVFEIKPRERPMPTTDSFDAEKIMPTVNAGGADLNISAATESGDTISAAMKTHAAEKTAISAKRGDKTSDTRKLNETAQGTHNFSPEEIKLFRTIGFGQKEKDTQTKNAKTLIGAEAAETAKHFVKSTEKAKKAPAPKSVSVKKVNAEDLINNCQNRLFALLALLTLPLSLPILALIIVIYLLCNIVFMIVTAVCAALFASVVSCGAFSGMILITSGVFCFVNHSTANGLLDIGAALIAVSLTIVTARFSAMLLNKVLASLLPVTLGFNKRFIKRIKLLTLRAMKGCAKL